MRSGPFGQTEGGVGERDKQGWETVEKDLLRGSDQRRKASYSAKLKLHQARDSVAWVSSVPVSNPQLSFAVNLSPMRSGRDDSGDLCRFSDFGSNFPKMSGK